MTTKERSTIVALSTPQGFGGVAIVRLSGNRSLSIIKSIFSSSNSIEPFKATYGMIRDGNYNIDTAIVTYFRKPRSYTGEDVIEISCHGSPYISERIIETCIKRGARLAEPGEFTKRAFLNGKMDLTQAESVADLIYSRTESAHKASMMLLEGRLGKMVDEIKKEVIKAVAHLEIELDFAEEDIQFTTREELVRTLEELNTKINLLVKSYQYGKLAQYGVKVTIAGPVNSGKSSLLNAFLEEERAIVSPHPGTTRDSIEESFQRGGYLFRLTDTAGLRETEDEVEKIGINIALNKIAEADLVLFVVDLTSQLDCYTDRILNGIKNKVVVVLNKKDIATDNQVSMMTEKFSQFDVVLTSAKFHQGIHNLAEIMVSTVSSRQSGNEDIIITKRRHCDALIKASSSLKRAIGGLKRGLPSEVVVIDLRLALESLDEILGKTTNEDILNYIFSQFCIGK